MGGHGEHRGGRVPVGASARGARRWAVVLAIGAVVAGCLGPAPARAQRPDPTTDEWREDLGYLAERLPRMHANVFHTVTREAFDSAVADLHSRLPELEDHEVMLGIARLTAMIGDGHTRVVGFGPYLTTGSYPLRMHPFADGLFVRRAAEAYGDVVGHEVLSIGGVPTEEALARIEPLVSADNRMAFLEELPWWLSVPEVHHALGLAPRHGPLTLEVETDGGPRTVEVYPTTERPTGLVDMRAPFTGEAPLHVRDRDRNYWFRHLPDQKAVYVQFNRVRDADTESIETFFGRVFALVDTASVETLVLDVRTNGGGDNQLTRPIVRGVIRSGIDRRGGFYVVTGRGTFSAAQNLVNDLERFTDAIFVGEPTGARPNSYGDAEPFTLPRTGLEVWVSTLYWQDVHPRDRREWTAPDLPAEQTSADYREGRDPALEAILGGAQSRPTGPAPLTAPPASRGSGSRPSPPRR